MDVILLCGGIGKRMFPISEDKFLLKFLGKTLLEHQIDTAKAAGLSHFIVVGNPKNTRAVEKIVNMIPGIKVDIVFQEEPRGIADALSKAARVSSGEVIVQSSNDIVESAAYTSLLSARKDDKASSFILSYKVDEYFPGGYLEVDANQNLKRIIEKPGKGRESGNLINILTHMHTDLNKLLSFAKKVETTRDDQYERALDMMVEEGQKIKVVRYDGFWLPIKYPWHIFLAMKRFLDLSKEYISPTAKISDKAIIEGEVTILDNVRVMENAVIRGPVFIGENSVIGNNCLVRDYTHIGANTVVGYSTEIKSSYIGDDCSFHHCYVGDSIIGDRCSFGFGTVFSNFRFDEKNIKIKVGGELVDTGINKLGAMVGNGTKTGVNVSIMPGVRIGSDSFISPNVCLTRDIEPGKFVFTRSAHQVEIKGINQG